MNSAGYGGQRSQPGYEAPACVQNAMMTKDKKPFTYTPGGIDLSQIKSERMAKRLARNAQAEGAATGISQQNRPSPNPGSPNGQNNVAGTMGAAAMGMPFQVLPPPPPPPPIGNSNAGKQQNGFHPAPPPPPPNAAAGKLAPPKVGNTPGSPNAARKSPTPQRFEPPPIGFRPEIKIPPNPMAALRKVAPPVEKNTFWKDEYVKERSKSPMPGEIDQNNSQRTEFAGLSNDQTTRPMNSDNSFINNNDCLDGARKTQQDHKQSYNMANAEKQDFPQLQYQTSACTKQEPLNTRTEIKSVPMPQSPTNAIYTRHSDSPRNDPPTNFLTNQRSQETPTRLACQNLPLNAPTFAQAPSSKVSPPVNQQSQAQTVPWRTPRVQNPTMPPSSQDAFDNRPGGNTYQQHQQQQQHQQRQQHQNSQAADSTLLNTQSQPQNQNVSKPTSVGSLYIAPLESNNNQQRTKTQNQQQHRDSPMRQAANNQTQQQRQPARWMTAQPQQREQPEWVRPDDNGMVAPSSLQRLKSPPPTQTQIQAPQMQYQPSQLQYESQFGGANYPTAFGMTQQNFGAHPVAAPSSGLRLQINTLSNQQLAPKERIIPIQLEQTPTPTYSPSQPNLNAASPGYVMRSPNQFVDQGYNNFPQASRQSQQREINQQRVKSPVEQLNAPRMVQQHQPLQQNDNKTRVVPISIEKGRNDGQSSATSIVVLPNDPRSPPIQSKSFRILQKITDTAEDDGNTKQTASTLANDSEPQLQRPQFSRQMSAQQAHNSPTIEQMRRMQIGHNQDIPTQYVHPSNQQVIEPKIYSGSAVPSKSFKILQAMTTPENAGPGQSDL